MPIELGTSLETSGTPTELGVTVEHDTMTAPGLRGMILNRSAGGEFLCQGHSIMKCPIPTKSESSKRLDR